MNESRLKWILEKSQRLNVYEWESMHTNAELPSVGLAVNEEQAKELAQHVLRMSQEIRRLKHKCGEEVWFGCNQGEESQEQEKQAYLEREKLLG